VSVSASSTCTLCRMSAHSLLQNMNRTSSATGTHNMHPVIFSVLNCTCCATIDVAAVYIAVCCFAEHGTTTQSYDDASKERVRMPAFVPM